MQHKSLPKALWSLHSVRLHHFSLRELRLFKAGVTLSFNNVYRWASWGFTLHIAMLQHTRTVVLHCSCLCFSMIVYHWCLYVPHSFEQRLGGRVTPGILSALSWNKCRKLRKISKYKDTSWNLSVECCWSPCSLYCCAYSTQKLASFTSAAYISLRVELQPGVLKY